MAAVGTRDRHCDSARRRFLRGVSVAALAALSAGAACAIVFAIASALGAIPDDVVVPGPNGEGPLTYGSVVASALIATTWAATAFALFVRFSRDPIRRFRITALIVFVVSLGTPFTIAGASAGMISTLLVMHALVAAISVWAFTVLIPRW